MNIFDRVLFEGRLEEIKTIENNDSKEYGFKIDEENNEVCFYCPKNSSKDRRILAFKVLYQCYKFLLGKVKVRKLQYDPKNQDLTIKEIEGLPVIYIEKANIKNIKFGFDVDSCYFELSYPPKKREVLNDYMNKNLEKFTALANKCKIWERIINACPTSVTEKELDFQAMLAETPIQELVTITDKLEELYNVDIHEPRRNFIINNKSGSDYLIWGEDFKLERKSNTKVDVSPRKENFKNHLKINGNTIEVQINPDNGNYYRARLVTQILTTYFTDLLKEEIDKILDEAYTKFNLPKLNYDINNSAKELVTTKVTKVEVKFSLGLLNFPKECTKLAVYHAFTHRFFEHGEEFNQKLSEFLPNYQEIMPLFKGLSIDYDKKVTKTPKSTKKIE